MPSVFTLAWVALFAVAAPSPGKSSPTSHQPKWRNVLEELDADDQRLGDAIDESSLVHDAVKMHPLQVPTKKRPKMPTNVKMFARPGAMVDMPVIAPNNLVTSVKTPVAADAPAAVPMEEHQNQSAAIQVTQFNEPALKESRDVKGNMYETMNNAKVATDVFEEVEAAMNPPGAFPPSVVLAPAVSNSKPHHRPAMQKPEVRVSVPENIPKAARLTSEGAPPNPELEKRAQAAQEAKAKEAAAADSKAPKSENIMNDAEAVSKPTEQGKMTKIDGASGMPLEDVGTPKVQKPADAQAAAPATVETAHVVVAGPQFPDSIAKDSDLNKPSTREVQKVTKLDGETGMPLHEENAVAVEKGNVSPPEQEEEEMPTEIDQPSAAGAADIAGGVGSFEQPEPDMKPKQSVEVWGEQEPPLPPPPTPKEMGHICPHPQEPAAPKRELTVVDGDEADDSGKMNKHVAAAPTEPEPPMPLPKKQASPDKPKEKSGKSSERFEEVTHWYQPPMVVPTEVPTPVPVPDYYVRIPEAPEFEEPVKPPISLKVIVENVPPFQVNAQEWYTGKVLVHVLGDMTGFAPKEIFPFYHVSATEFELIPCDAKMSDLKLLPQYPEIKVLVGCEGGYDQCNVAPQIPEPGEPYAPTPKPSPHAFPKCKRKRGPYLPSPSPFVVKVPLPPAPATPTPEPVPPTPTPIGMYPLLGDPINSNPADWHCADPAKCGKNAKKRQATDRKVRVHHVAKAKKLQRMN